MKLRMFQVDAFAEQVFEGNPAAIVPLESWLPDSLLQAIAEENNLSETAYFVPAGDAFELRWFTPVEEVDLCGHATLASAHVVYAHLGYSGAEVRFLTRSGELRVARLSETDRRGRSLHSRTGSLRMDFPEAPPRAVEAPAALLGALGAQPSEVLAAFDYVAVFDSEDQIRALAPDFAQLQALDLRGVVATAPGREVDFVSRCFFPKFRINEDPVTGSSHCEMAPYWAARLGREVLRARQLSRRGGSLTCEVRGGRVLLSGNAVDFMTAEIEV